MYKKENYIQIFAILRNVHNLYSHKVRLTVNDKIEEEIDIEEIRNYIEENPIESYNILEIVKTAEYRKLLDILEEENKELKIIVSNILDVECREYELKKIKEKSLKDYVDSLREVTIEELLESISEGYVINAKDLDGKPKEIESDERYSGVFMKKPIVTAKLDAKYLSKVIDLVSLGKIDYSSKGIRLRQIFIYGEVNMNFIKLGVPLSFQGCYFSDWISAENFEVPLLTFDWCDFISTSPKIYPGWALIASGLKVNSHLRFMNCENLTQLFLPNAELGIFYLENPLENENEDIRTVFDSIKIKELYIPEQSGDNNFYVNFDRGSSIERLTGEYKDILEWLKNSQIDGAVWDIFADAYENAGNPDDAVNLRIAFKQYENSKEFKGKKRNSIARFFTWLSLDCTVKFFHKPFRAIFFLVFNFFITWLLAALSFKMFVYSPAASRAFTEVWLHDFLSVVVWGFMYAIDLTFYPLNLGQVDNLWSDNIYLALFFALIKATSIIYLGLFLGGVTNILNKRNGIK